MLLFALDVAGGEKRVSPEDVPRRLLGNVAEAECRRSLFPLIAAIADTLKHGFEISALQSSPHMVLLREDFYTEPGPDQPSLRLVVERFGSGGGGEPGRGVRFRGLPSLRTLLALWLLPLLRRHDVEAARVRADGAPIGLSDDDVVAFVVRAPQA